MGRFKDLIENNFLILHGALGTELEYKGYDISGKLWTAQHLEKNPDAIREIHEEYVLAGADIVTTSSYQASVLGLVDAGYSEVEAKSLIRKSVILAKEARDNAWSKLSDEEKEKRIFPLISGDVGPYAGYLADGSEYTGNYGEVTKEDLKNFHRERIALMLDEGVDILALETMPNILEIEALKELLENEFAGQEAYLSVTSQDGKTLSDGTPISKLLEIVEDSEEIVLIGINCSSADNSNEFLKDLAKQSKKYLIAYPNSGEEYDGATQTWHEGESSNSLFTYSDSWLEIGVRVIGGCCRTRPEDISKLNSKYRK